MIGIFNSKHSRSKRNFDISAGSTYLSDSSEDKLHEINMEKLSDIMDFLVHLKNTGRLRDKEFSTLINLACAGFIRNEFSIIFGSIMSNTLKDILSIGAYKDEW